MGDLFVAGLAPEILKCAHLGILSECADLHGLIISHHDNAAISIRL
jgi:hypothetical protein